MRFLDSTSFHFVPLEMTPIRNEYSLTPTLSSRPNEVRGGISFPPRGHSSLGYTSAGREGVSFEDYWVRAGT